MQLHEVTVSDIPTELVERRLALIDQLVTANRLAPDDAERLREEALWRIDDFGAAVDDVDKFNEDMVLYFNATPADAKTAELTDRVRARLVREGRLTQPDPARAGSSQVKAARYPARSRPRPRGHSSRRTARTSQSSDDGPERPRRPLTGRERSYLKQLVDAFVRERLASRKVCQSCYLDLPREAFRPARRTCQDCEITARTDRRHAARAVAA